MKKIKSVMLIDDSEIDLFINQKVLQKFNFIERIQTFKSAIDALNYLKLIEDENAYYSLLAPQLIFLDINMPVMDGFAFLDEFDKLKIFKQKNIDIFLLSTSLNPDDINKANENKNVSGLILKPLAFDKLTSFL